MKISILGGGGFLGRKIAAKLAKDGTLGGKPVTALTLFDMAEPPKPDASFPVTSVGGDVVDAARRRDPDGHRRRVPSRRRGQRAGGGGLRPRPAGQHPRHRRGDRSLPSAGNPPAGGVHQFGRQLQRRPEFTSCRTTRARSPATAMARKRPRPS